MLPQLPYPVNALEPYMDSKTMEIHHGKHHQGYVDKLNATLAPYPNLSEKPIGDLLKDLSQVPEQIRTAVKNTGGGHYNHSLFWEIMAPNDQKTENRPPESIIKKWGTIDKFKEEFSSAALALFGSGWAWLTIDTNGELKITQTQNQDCPLSIGQKPILCLDVWEHAYYLKYQNRRAEYIENWINNLINWKVVAEKLATASI